MSKVCFVVSGQFITNLAREAYWFENRRQWAVNVLKTLHNESGTISDDLVKDILNGDITLIGDSQTGITPIQQEDKEFKKKLAEWKKWQSQNYIEIGGRVVDKAHRYVENIVKRIRQSLLGQSTLLFRNPFVMMKLEEKRKELHEQIIRSAGLTGRDSTSREYLEFATALNEHLDKVAGPLVGEDM